MSPFAPLVAWRTWVHARNRLELGTLELLGILEGGIVGFNIVAAPLAIGMVTLGRLFQTPLLAIGYVLVYAAIGALVGLGVGLALWIMATIVLAACRLFPAQA
jgi:hypothetical protein